MLKVRITGPTEELKRFQKKYILNEKYYDVKDISDILPMKGSKIHHRFYFTLHDPKKKN